VIKSKDLGLLFDITMTIDLPELLCRVNFPLYQACMVSPRHLLLAGGGGAAKTGVFNGFVSRLILDSYGNLRLFSDYSWPILILCYSCNLNKRKFLAPVTCYY
jgi:hypothetical protein